MPCGVASLRAFNENADDYDSTIGREEFFMGVGILRWWLLGEADGETLEVACGTARNLSHYKPRPPSAPSSSPGTGVTALTLVDTSEGMLDKARIKARQHVRANGVAKVSLLRASAGALPFEDDAFDTVVDTFGLCSMDDPEGALRELGRVCRPGGKILLLEHGLGTWDFINRMLERGAKRHLDKWGCQFNRDIAAIVRRSGLRVERSQRWHFGTTHVYVCTPPKTASAPGHPAEPG